MKIKKVFRYPKLMLWAFIMEGQETRDMVTTFAKKGKGMLLLKTSANGPSEEEMKKAVAQLKDIPRFLPFFMLVVVPAPGVTEGYVLLATTLEKWLGHRFSILPTHFRNIFQKKEETGTTIEPAANEPLP